jgi:hypothetical protein
MIHEERASQDSFYLVQEGCCIYYHLLSFLICRLHHNARKNVFTKHSRSLRIPDYERKAAMQRNSKFRSAATFARLARIVRLRDPVREVTLQHREFSQNDAIILRHFDQYFDICRSSLCGYTRRR